MKYFYLLPLLALTAPVAVHAEKLTKSHLCCEGLSVVNVRDLTEQDIDPMMQGKCPNVAIEFSTGTKLSLSMFLKGDILSFAQDKDQFSAITVERTFYARCVEDNLMLSTDLLSWTPISDFITGNVNLQLLVQDQTPVFSFKAELNCKG